MASSENKQKAAGASSWDAVPLALLYLLLIVAPLALGTRDGWIPGTGPYGSVAGHILWSFIFLGGMFFVCMILSTKKKPASKSWKDLPWGWIYWIGVFPIAWLVFGMRYGFSAGQEILPGGFLTLTLSLGIGMACWRIMRLDAIFAAKAAKEAAVEKLKQEELDKIRAEEARVAEAEEAEKAEKAEKARLEKEALENAQKPKLSALEAAKLAISLVETMSLEELRPVIEILKKSDEIAEVLKNANDELIGRYSEKIEAIYASRGIMSSEPFYDTQLKTDLERCMSLGMNSIEKKLELEGISVSVPSTVSGKKIEKTRKWQEIQRDLK